MEKAVRQTRHSISTGECRKGAETFSIARCTVRMALSSAKRYGDPDLSLDFPFELFDAHYKYHLFSGYIHSR